jgi:hypothetical protein
VRCKRTRRGAAPARDVLNQARRRSLLERVEDLVVVQRAHPSDRVQTELAAHHRGEGEDRPAALGLALEPPPDDLLCALRDRQALLTPPGRALRRQQAADLGGE